jgi:hypothetical protein
MAPNAGRKTPNATNAHFGNQVRKERLARGWSLRQFAAESGIDLSTASMIENGKLAPNRRIAEACDRVFPNREGWFAEYFQDSQSWIMPGLRSWAEHENGATRLDIWCPSALHGLLQIPDYARVMLSLLPGVTNEQVNARLDRRMARREHMIERKNDPPVVTCIVDHDSLYRLVGSPEIMAAQMRKLLEIGSLGHVTVQILPAVAHPATASELIIADNRAAYVEHLAAGAVYIERERVSALEQVFATIRAESYRASESAAVIREAEQLWTSEATGESQVTAVPTARASRRLRDKA